MSAVTLANVAAASAAQGTGPGASTAAWVASPMPIANASIVAEAKMDERLIFIGGDHVRHGRVVAVRRPFEKDRAYGLKLGSTAGHAALCLGATDIAPRRVYSATDDTTDHWPPRFFLVDLLENCIQPPLEGCSMPSIRTSVSSVKRGLA